MYGDPKKFRNYEGHYGAWDNYWDEFYYGKFLFF